MEVLGCDGYDPHWLPTKPKGKFQTILCTYVVNVLPKKEILPLLQSMRAHLKKGGSMLVSVRRDLPEEGREGRGCVQYPHKLDKYGESIKKTKNWEMYRIT